MIVKSKDGDVLADNGRTGSIKGISAIAPRGFGCFCSLCMANNDASNAHMAVRRLDDIRSCSPSSPSHLRWGLFDASHLFHAHSNHALPPNASSKANGKPLGPSSRLISSESRNFLLACLEVTKGNIDGRIASENAKVPARMVTRAGCDAGK
jgi:hypothetical protein